MPSYGIKNPCPRCPKGSLLNDGEEFKCLSCGFIPPDQNSARDLIWDENIGKYRLKLPHERKY